MKQYLWIIGLVLVILAAFGFALSGSTEQAALWNLSILFSFFGGLILIGSLVSYHKPSKKHK